MCRDADRSACLGQYPNSPATHLCSPCTLSLDMNCQVNSIHMVCTRHPTPPCPQKQRGVQYPLNRAVPTITCAPNESPPGPRAVREPLDQVAPPSAASHVSEPTMFPLRLPGCPAAFRMWHLSRSNQCLLEKNWVPPGAEKRGGGYSVRGDGEGKFFDCPPGEKECTIVPRTGNGPPRADFGKGG